MDIVAKYVGANGEHYMGIPDRDITRDEWERMSSERRELVQMSQFYEVQGGEGEPVLKPQGDVTSDSRVMELLTTAPQVVEDESTQPDAEPDPDASKKEGRGKR